MAEATVHTQYPQAQLPPSPPPSPPAVRRRNKKKRHDSFIKFANSSISPPSSVQGDEAVTDQEQDSLFTRIIYTPILVISFILSLTFINARDRANRTRAHSNSSILSSLYPSSWLDPEPYQDPDDSTWGMDGTPGHVEPDDAVAPKNAGGRKKRESWHLHKKIRKVAKMEIGDAFEMRGRVVVAMLVVFGLACVLLGMSVKWMWGTMSSALFA